MSQKTIWIVVVVIVVVALLGYSQGWFGGGGDAGDAPATGTEEQSGG